VANPADIDFRKSPKRASDRRKFLRNSMWPEVHEADLWLRTKNVGFTTVPRVISLVGRIADHLSGKGFPVSSTYLALWCWVFDEAFLEVRNPREVAFESGFSGPRAETTWRSRMARLQELGFIKAAAGVSGDYHYVLLLNPIKVIEKLYKERPRDMFYNALLSRLSQVGADDLQVEETNDPRDGISAGIFVIDRTTKGQYYFNYRAPNGEPVLKSEMYVTRASAEKGVVSVKNNSLLDDRYERKIDKSGAEFFILKAGNHEIIGISETYSNEAALESAIELIKRYAPSAPVIVTNN
jgi:uncharacterized protein YegP (UPF0339 family)